MMWGDRSPRAKLTGDSRRGFEVVLIGDCRSFRSLARNWPLRLLRLLQQYLPIADMRYSLAANKAHRPGSPLSANDPRSENFSPAPATRSVTTRETRPSFESDCAIT